MAESNPGDNGDYGGQATKKDSSPSSQPSSLHIMRDGSFEKTVTSHLLAETFHGLEFRVRSSQEKCPSFTYASLPGVYLAPLKWKVCCEPEQKICGEYVTYHKLTDSDDSLSTVMANYAEPNIAGLIIINTSNSTTLSSDFINKADQPTTPPVYIISLEDGDKLTTFVSTHDKGAVQVKVLVESTVDTVSTPGMSTRLHLPLSNKSDSQSKLDRFNLHEELKKILFVHKKEKLHICANQVQFQFSISCFHNYEAQTRRDSHDKAIKMLGHFTEDNFKKDFLFYLLLAHRFLVYHMMYDDSNVMNNYVKMCIEKFEAMNDVQAMADVILTFIECGDFTVQINHGPKCEASVFQLLYHTVSVMLKKSNKLHAKTHKINIYCRILWIMYFGLQVNVSASLLTPIWKTDLLSDQVQRELAFSDDIIKEFARGFELLSALRLPEGVYFLPSELAIFLNPLKIKTLHISHIMKLLNAGQHYLNWNLISLCHILPPIRSNYKMFFNTIKVGWTRYSKDGTKIGVYKESLMFLECIYDWIPESNQNDEDDKWADVARSHIEEWIELLVDHLDMCADDAIEYVRLLRSWKKHRKFITSKIQTKGMQIVADLTLSHFSMLFNGSLIWRLEFVEAFLNNYNVPKTIDLKNTSWKQLLKEIVTRFPVVNCKRCIVGLIGRISKAYKSAGRQNVFVLDLLKMGIPNLLFVKSYKQSDTNVEKLFIDMVSAFIQRNGLRESTLEQIPAIMKLVEPDNHLQGLILTAMQKEAVPDSKMLEKLYLTDHLKLVIHESVTAACNSLTALSQLSEVDKFYWHFVASCCYHIQPNRENLAKLNTYLFLIEKFSVIFHKYCTKNNLEKSFVINTIPLEISRILNPDVKNYFNWFAKMQEIMIHWQSKFMEHDFSYDDTFAYAGKLQSIAAFAKAVCTEHLVYTADEITKLKDDYSALYAKLCSLLVQTNKDYSWCTLVELLSYYGIKFSHTLQAKLDTHLILPEGGPVIITDNMQQIILHHQLIDQTELKAEMTLRFKKSMTWKILQEIFNDLQIFLGPLMSHLEFLAYFHLHNCEMFSKHLKNQMAKLAEEPAEEPAEESAIKLILPSVGTTELFTEKLFTEKVFQFATALQSTKDFILSLIKGTAKYAEIFAKGLLEEELIDIESEFKIMCTFPDFQEISPANEEGKEGIKHMLELFQYSKQISVIPEVCSQYQLDQCLQDPKLNELMDIVNSVKTAEDKDIVTGKIANHHMKTAWKILKFDDTSIAERCLEIFPAVANCTKFYQFIQNKGFANNTNAFRSQVDLIRALLQHEDYNETVLNHLMPAFQYICPFLDKEQSLGDLMNKIIKLYHDGIGFGCESRRDFCQLETVNSNIIMIQLWFFRTEEYCTGLIQEVRDQEKKATEALKSQLSQSHNKVEELTKDLTMERSVNETAKIEMENLTKQLQQLQNDKEMLERQINILQAQLEKALDPLENIEKLPEVVDLGVEIGRGSYGLVKKVSMHGTTCAAKDIHAILINYASDKELKRITKSFLEECVKCSKLFHPNIVQFLGIHYPSKQAKLPWLVMELLDCSLTGFVEKYNKESVSQFVRASIFCDISHGLQFLHGQDIIHRDLSSNNILLTSHLTAKIADLGVAKLIDPDGSRSHTLAPGTKTFLPPEVFSAKPRYGKPVDVFSLGCIMIHVTTHQWPDPADETHYDETLGKKVVLSEITRRKVYLNTIQGPIKILILSYLHDNPKQRPEIAMVVAELQKLKSSCQKPVSFNIVEFESHSKLQQKTNEQLIEKQREMNEHLLEKQRELAEIKKKAQ